MLRPDDAYERYERAWNEPERTAAILAECWAEDGIYADDEVSEGVVGPAALTALIAATHAELPGFWVRGNTAPRMLAGRLAITWTQEGGNPPVQQAGTDVIEFGTDGRIARVTNVLATS